MRRSDIHTHSHFTPMSPPLSKHSEMLPPEQPGYRDKGMCSSPTKPTSPVAQMVHKSKVMNQSHDPGVSCFCLQSIFSLLGNLENEDNLIESSTLDSVLAFHKETLTQCNALLRCAACTARSEHLLLFLFVCEKLVNFSEKMVNRYLHRPHTQSELLIENNLKDVSVSMASQQKVSVGKYEVDLPVELDCLFKVLMALQLKALEKLLISFRKTILVSMHAAKFSKIFHSERKVEALAKKLQRSEALARQL